MTRIVTDRRKNKLKTAIARKRGHYPQEVILKAAAGAGDRLMNET